MHREMLVGFFHVHGIIGKKGIAATDIGQPYLCGWHGLLFALQIIAHHEFTCLLEYLDGQWPVAGNDVVLDGIFKQNLQG